MLEIKMFHNVVSFLSVHNYICMITSFFTEVVLINYRIEKFIYDYTIKPNKTPKSVGITISSMSSPLCLYITSLRSLSSTYAILIKNHSFLYVY